MRSVPDTKQTRIRQGRSPSLLYLLLSSLPRYGIWVDVDDLDLCCEAYASERACSEIVYEVSVCFGWVEWLEWLVTRKAI